MESPNIPNEFDRLLALADYDLDTTELEDQLKDLTKLAAKVAGTDISLVNLIDAVTQWSVAGVGMPVMQLPREDSVCQYTIKEDQSLEIKDLSKDDRFKDKFYVEDDPNLRYYYGVPLKTSSGHNLGALCVLDTKAITITPEKTDLLKIIAEEIINRLDIIKSVNELKSEVKDSIEKQEQVAHDIRGPIGGIIGLAQIIKDQGTNNQLEDVLEFIKVIQSSSQSLLELADQILSTKAKGKSQNKLNLQNEYNLQVLKEKLNNLYAVQAEQKKVKFSVQISSKNLEKSFSKVKLLQIIGNLISNAIKFTPEGGSVSISLSLEEKNYINNLRAKISDTGTGMTAAQIEEILNGESQTTQGTAGELGYGFGLPLVKHLIDGLGGVLKIDSKLGEYSAFEVIIPV
ncbi:ATP-binding protein [Cyclobacterium sp. 1_MG-2023]|uniref:GAF domain-containing sensor histidine kinase n=1 Tax=Cyclobacterium sp. 1_MG-2023 TaxID=3062681 RepID=UPI0026E124A3|nr:ATP-binding protein [Cyclobacterium sp. 1_MG-2023]MDO6438944.1 ATP-binding protein [Cyclobacterium sp. 1_MG-2023]